MTSVFFNKLFKQSVYDGVSKLYIQSFAFLSFDKAHSNYVFFIPPFGDREGFS